MVAEKLRSALATMVRAHHEIALGPQFVAPHNSSSSAGAVEIDRFFNPGRI